MSRTITIDPITRIEGHAKVHIEINDDNQVETAFFHTMEFRGFEKFVEGMQIELMPTLTTRVCGTCPHAHHLVQAQVRLTLCPGPVHPLQHPFDGVAQPSVGDGMVMALHGSLSFRIQLDLDKAEGTAHVRH